jgi:hypothetical protein
LQRGAFILHFSQAQHIGEISYSKPEDLADHYAALLADEQVPNVSPAESQLIEIFNKMNDMGDTVAGAALMAGAIFGKDMSRVQGMGVFFKSNFWRELAIHFVDEDNLSQWHDAPDKATGAVSRLLAEKRNLSMALVKWRDVGQRKARSKGMIAERSPQLEGPGRTVSKNDPCPCGSGRKARRCHPSGIALTTD